MVIIIQLDVVSLLQTMSSFMMNMGVLVMEVWFSVLFVEILMESFTKSSWRCKVFAWRLHGKLTNLLFQTSTECVQDGVCESYKVCENVLGFWSSANDLDL